MRHVFLTGASGFLGRAVAARLREHGHRITGLSRTAGDASTVMGDLGSPASYEKALRGTDVVVHLAAVTGQAPAGAFTTVNIEGTRTLLDAARRAGVSRVLFCSSIAVTFADIRRYPYAQSKMAGETLVRESGLRFAIVRPTIIAGPGSPVIEKLRDLAALPLIPAFGGGRARVQPILVEDLADFVVDVVDEDRFDGETLELGGRDVLSIRELLARLRTSSTSAPARFLPVPLGPLLAVLNVVEPAFGRVLPVTAGQLATFRFDGVAQPNALWQSRRARLAPLDRVLSSSGSR